jgi:hypothetical protein
MVIPRTSIKEVLTLIHDNPAGGHLGISKTTEKVRERFYWASYKEDIEKHIRCCTACVVRENPPRAAKGSWVSI